MSLSTAPVSVTLRQDALSSMVARRTPAYARITLSRPSASGSPAYPSPVISARSAVSVVNVPFVRLPLRRLVVACAPIVHSANAFVPPSASFSIAAAGSGAGGSGDIPVDPWLRDVRIPDRLIEQLLIPLRQFAHVKSVGWRLHQTYAHFRPLTDRSAVITGARLIPFRTCRSPPKLPPRTALSLFLPALRDNCYSFSTTPKKMIYNRKPDDLKTSIAWKRHAFPLTNQ